MGILSLERHFMPVERATQVKISPLLLAVAF
jgi:hypothetical protein